MKGAGGCDPVGAPVSNGERNGGPVRTIFRIRSPSPWPTVPAWLPSALPPIPSPGIRHYVMVRGIERRSLMRQFPLDFPDGSRVGFAHSSTPRIPPVTGGDHRDPLRGTQVLLLWLQPGELGPYGLPGFLHPGGLFCFCESGRARRSPKAWRTTWQGDESANVPHLGLRQQPDLTP